MANIKQDNTSLISTGDGMFIIDQEQKVTSWNEAAEEFLGYKAEDIIGTTCWELLQGCTLKGQIICRPGGPTISKATQGGPVRHFDLCVRHRDGHTILIDIQYHRPG